MTTAKTFFFIKICIKNCILSGNKIFVCHIPFIF